MRFDICYTAVQGFASRMLTQTDLLGRLRDAGKTVAVIATDRNDPVLSRYCRERDIALFEFDVKQERFSEDYLVKRRYLLEDIRANTALWEKHVAATQYFKARNPLRRWRPHYYYLLHRLIPRFPAIRNRFLQNEKRYLQSAEAERLIAEIRPAKLIATYPVNLNEAVLLHYGNRHPDVQTWIHLQSWDNITCKGRFAEVADRYIAWGPVMLDELKQHYGVEDAHVHVCGVPHFDQHFDPGNEIRRPVALRQLGLDPARPYFVIAMSSPRFAPREIDIAEWLAHGISAGDYGDCQLLVRPHPQNVQGYLSDKSWLPRLQALVGQPGIGVAFPQMAKSKMAWSLETDDMVELSALLSGAAVVLNSGSTISIDALMHDRPVVLTSFDGAMNETYWRSARRLINYPHLAKLIDMGGITVTRSYAELGQALRQYLAVPGLLADEREQSARAECLARDGAATSRVVQALLAY
jgi:hypothetical protein